MKLKLLFCLFLMTIIASGQIIFSDNFSSYTSNSQLSGQGNWTNNSSNPGGMGTCAGIGCINTQVKDFPILFSNYGGSNKSINIAPNGDATGLTFTSVNTGSVYFSFLINFSDAVIDPNNASSNDFFRVMGGGNFNTLFRLNAFKVGTNFVLALQKESGTKVLTNNLSFNTTYLVVLKYTFNPGTTDDVVSLYLNPNFTNPEPSSPTISTSAGSNISEFTSIDRMNFRTNWTVIPTGYISSVNVFTAWNLLNSTAFTSKQESLKVIVTNANSGSLQLIYNKDIYKNPTYKIFSIDGKLIVKGTVVKNNYANTEIQIPVLAKGSYILVLYEDGIKESQKFSVF